MTILYLHQYFNTPKMSGGTRSYEMARRLVKMGHTVHMVTSFREETSNKDWFTTIEDGINVHWLPLLYSNKMSYAQRIKAFFNFAIKSATKAISIKSDIVFATSTPLTIALPAVYASKKQKIPMVFEVRDLWPELPIAMGALKNPITQFLAKKLELFAYKNSKAIVALSPGMKEGVSRTGFLPQSIAVIPNSCDIEMFTVENKHGDEFRKNRPWLQNDPFILYTGTFGLINGVGYMVGLAKELLNQNSNIKILIIGRGIEYDKVIKMAKENNVFEKNLFIESNIPKESIPNALNAAAIASSLFLDKKEMQANSANKFFDALAAKKPIMINYGGWQKDLIEKSGCGLVIWRLTYEQAVKRIIELISDKETLVKSSKSSALLAKEYFSRDLLAQQLEEVLLNVKAENYNDISKIAPGNYNNIQERT